MNPTPDSPPPDTRPAPGVLRRIGRSAGSVVAVVWIVLEDWLWDGLLRLMAWFGRLPPIRWLETHIENLPPWAALIAFLSPAAVLLPFKLFAFWLIAEGHRMLGLQVFIIAKLIGTALLARIFALTKPSLMTIGWFRRAYEAFSGWKARIKAYVRNLPLVQRVSVWRQQLRLRLAQAWKRLKGTA